MTRKKWLLVGLIAAPLLTVACLAAFVKVSGSLAEYRFLKGAEPVLAERMESSIFGQKNAIVHVYNVHTPLKSLGNSMDKELKAHGYSLVGPSALFNGGQMMWVNPSMTMLLGRMRSSGSVALPSYSMVMAVDGRIKILPSSAPKVPVDEVNRADGWTGIMIVEEYKPNWFQSFFDRFNHAPNQSLENLNLQVVPGADYRRQYMGQIAGQRPAKTGRKP